MSLVVIIIPMMIFSLFELKKSSLVLAKVYFLKEVEREKGARITVNSIGIKMINTV